MNAIQITERFLMDTGGWQAMKHARALFEMSRVVSFHYEPPILKGLVREGTIDYRAGLKINTRTDVENLCTCRESQSWGKICAHSLALGLAWLRRQQTPVVVANPIDRPRPPAGPTLVLGGEGKPATAHFIVPPNFLSGWQKKQVMLGCEVDVEGRRVLASALDAKATYVVSREDLLVLSALRELCGGQLPGMQLFDLNQFTQALQTLVDHPRVTLGRDRPVQISGEAIKPSLRVSVLDSGQWEIRSVILPLGDLLMSDHAAWFWHEHRFQPVAPKIPAAYLGLLREPVRLAATQAEAFLDKELANLALHFSHVDAPRVQLVEPGVPQTLATFEGSLNYLSCKVQFVYGKRIVTYGATSPNESFVYEENSARRKRNLHFENAQFDRLHRAGFQGPSYRGEIVLKGQNSILAFFARELPHLEKDWKVIIGSRFQNVTRDVEKIRPQFNVVGSGQDWFEISYSLESSGGQKFSAGEVQRLLQSGQGFTRLRNQRFAVFDPDSIGEIQDILRDCQPEQKEPGRYRIHRSQAGFLEAAAEEAGARILGGNRWQQWTRELRQLKPPEAVPLGDLEQTLRPYQKQGVYWLHFLRNNFLGGILADEMGLGKTLQTLAYLRDAPKPALVVCPASLIFNWQREAQRFVPSLDVLVIEGPQRFAAFAKIGRSDLVLTSYPLLRRDVENYLSVDFGVVVLDEATHIKNPDSQNAQAASALRARHRLVLTGTPVENSVRDIWSIMNFAMPGYLNDRDDFRERYELPIGRGSLPERERLARRLRPIMLRRLKRDVVKELPEKIEQVSYCDLSDDQRELYGKLQSEGRRKIQTLGSGKDRTQARMVMLTTLLRLRQVCCDLRLLRPDYAKPSTKLELLLELIEEAIDGGHRVLIFSQFVRMLQLIRASLDENNIAFTYLDGSTKDRAGEVDRFQSPDGPPIFLISLKAGGVGLNLSAADTVFHFDPWWNPAVENQATDRAHRIGQQRVVTAYKLIARNTVEEKILQLQQKKRAIIAATVDTEEPMMEGLNMEEIASLLEEG